VTAPVGGFIETTGRLTKIFAVTGVLVILHTLLMDRESLQDPWIPVHIAVLGIVGAILYSTPARVRTLEVIALAALSFGLTWLSGAVASKGAVFVPGWAILGAWGARIILRGGDR